jgi:hypothetical protein
MSFDDAKKFLENHDYLHDSIVDKCIIKNSTYVDNSGNIVFRKRNFNEVKLTISSQKGYRIEIIIRGVNELRVHESHELIIFRVCLKRKGDRILFSLTGDFSEGHTWFEAETMEFKQLEND